MDRLELPKSKYPIHRQIESKNLSAYIIVIKKEKTDLLQKELAKRLKARYDTKMDGNEWMEVSSDGDSVFWGDYSPNYEYVKEAFAVRSGLVSKDRLFSENESADLFNNYLHFCSSFYSKFVLRIKLDLLTKAKKLLKPTVVPAE